MGNEAIVQLLLETGKVDLNLVTETGKKAHQLTKNKVCQNVDLVSHKFLTNSYFPLQAIVNMIKDYLKKQIALNRSAQSKHAYPHNTFSNTVHKIADSNRHSMVSLEPFEDLDKDKRNKQNKYPQGSMLDVSTRTGNRRGVKSNLFKDEEDDTK